MDKRRVVVTGMGIASPLGCDVAGAAARVQRGESGICAMPEWDSIDHFAPRLAAPVALPDHLEIPRKASRTMGRVAQLATVASGLAIEDAGLAEDELRGGGVGLAYGSTHGSSAANEEWVRKLIAQNGFLGLSSTTYLKFMSHTTAANLAIHYGIRGRVISTSAACVSGSQAIGYGFEAISSGIADAMVCGGAEELHFTHVAVFDMLYAASKAFNDTPDQSPRPFDARRDGLVVGEGAGTFVLEEYERARRLGKHIYAEIVGYGTNCDGTHVTNPSRDGMRGAMELALSSAGAAPDDIDYVNAHATATVIGDVAESEATYALFGDRVPVSSLKGHIGHTLGACGAIEAALTIAMLRGGWIAPTRNLDKVDAQCAPLDYVMGASRSASLRRVMCNKFAFGGINTSLIFATV
ncbi:MAG TPA: beta-ketoacyl-ACP synthase [Kofleriaceae bacterium]|nr:beta-ketoacyl-ACP synthase [Kofleriaceae bacterium]